jgi:hypothetical protein
MNILLDHPEESAEYARFAVPLMVGMRRDVERHPGAYLLSDEKEISVDQFVDLEEVSHLYVPLAYIPWVNRWLAETKRIVDMQIQNQQEAAREGFLSSRSRTGA